MKFDFETIMDRRGHDAIAIDAIGKGEGMAPEAPKEGFDPIPMWVADMNFPTVPTVQEEIIERTKHPAFGYFSPTKEYYESIIRWQERHNGVKGLKPVHIGYENGVLGGVVSALNVLCSKGDHVLLHSPTYIGFTHTLENNGYDIVSSPLYLDEDNIWRMNYADMEEKIVKNHIHCAIFCSPFNPCGRVWEREELEKAMAIFEKHQVWVISDEIWSDLTLDGYHHIPLQSVSNYAREHTAAFYAPSKTFNLAGLVGSYHIIYNDWLRERVLKESSLCHYNEMNVLSMHGLIGAYKEEGYQWLEELRHVLTKNVMYAYNHIKDNYPGIEVGVPQGTYMLFMHCEEYLKAHNMTIQELEKAGWDVGVGWQDGVMFKDPYGIRLNLASPYSRIVEAFERLDRYVFNQAKQ